MLENNYATKFPTCTQLQSKKSAHFNYGYTVFKKLIVKLEKPLHLNYGENFKDFSN